MEKTEILGGTPQKGLNRRKFLRGMAATAGLGLGAGILAACGDNTPTSPSAATLAPTTAPAATTAASTTAAPVATTSAAPATAPATTVAATTAAAPTTAAPGTAAPTAATSAANGATGAAPAGYVEVGKISAAGTAPVGFSAGSTKGYVFARSTGEVYTYSNICTHMGCEVPAYKTSQNMFMCPCHGSEYSNTGEVLKGPAKARLPLFDNKVVGDVIYAKLS